MAKPSQVMILANRMAREIVANQTAARIMLAFDELAGLYVDDAEENHDEHIDYAKGKRDEIIRKIVGDDNFVEFNKAYGEAYIDELKRIRILEERRAEQ